MALWSRKSPEKSPGKSPGTPSGSGRQKFPGSKDYGKLSARERAITFYGEDSASWPHLEPIITELTTRHQRTICYLTSDDADPVLTRNDPHIHTFSIGDGFGRSFLFQMMETGVMVATVPQLGITVLPRAKRAATLGTKYVYVFHSMASTHMIYEADAFDYYDTVLCVGPYMELEIRARERLANLQPKELLAHGYGRLDAILAAGSQTVPRAANTPAVVLIAPSWGPTCIFETCGTELVEVLLGAGFEVIARPHPMTSKRSHDTLTAFAQRFDGRERFTLERDVASQDSLHRCDIMISDWSGAAMEYAFGRERPVLFIDVPRKVNNPNYSDLGIEPFEASIRDKIGAVVAPDALASVPEVVRTLIADPESFRTRIQQVRGENIANIGTSAGVAADLIAAKADAYLARIPS